MVQTYAGFPLEVYNPRCFLKLCRERFKTLSLIDLYTMVVCSRQWHKHMRKEGRLGVKVEVRVRVGKLAIPL